MVTFGTNTTLDTLAASQQTIAQFGEDRAFDAIQAGFDAQNNLLNQALDGLVEKTGDRQRRYGGTDNMTFGLLDQYGTPDAQKVTAGVTIGVPLNGLGRSLQWTYTAFQRMTGAQMAAQTTALMLGDRLAVLRLLKTAWMTPTNYSFLDVLVDNVSLPVKALVNADGAAIANGPNGETFNGSSHTHYLATASLVAADLTALSDTLVEHTAEGNLVFYINKAQQTAVSALTGFTAIQPVRVTPASTTAFVEGDLEPMQLNNRLIGVFGNSSAEVWVKPWVPANYILGAVLNHPMRPFLMRQDPVLGSDLHVIYEDEVHPLRARGTGRTFGFGVWNRTAAAVLYTGGGSYVTPTIT
jgi:hypothetical protein